MAMTYRVELGYNKFDFSDAAIAITFAEMAKKSYVGDRYDKTLSVSMTLVDKKELDNEEE